MILKYIADYPILVDIFLFKLRYKLTISIEKIFFITEEIVKIIYIPLGRYLFA